MPKSTRERRAHNLLNFGSGMLDCSPNTPLGQTYMRYKMNTPCRERPGTNMRIHAYVNIRTAICEGFNNNLGNWSLLSPENRHGEDMTHVGKIRDGMGNGGPLPYHGMVWDIGLRSHTIAGMVWVLNGMFHGMGYPWDVPWDGTFSGYFNGMSHWDAIFGGTCGRHIAGCCSGAIMGAIFGSHIAGCCSGETLGATFGSHICWATL